MKKKKILIVAHPDDETLFFSGPLITYQKDLHVVLVTDGNADNKGQERIKQFQCVMKDFGIDSFEMYLLRDLYDVPLCIKELSSKIKNTFEFYCENKAEVFTHGPFGEYGHPHHIQVSFAVHKFCHNINKVFHPNILDLENSELIFDDNEMYIKKLKILTTYYKEEYSKFVSLLAPKRVEKFISPQESVCKITKFLCDQKEDLPDNIGPYQDFRESLILFKNYGLSRKF